jgi:hypothetical protein
LARIALDGRARGKLPVFIEYLAIDAHDGMPAAPDNFLVERLEQRGSRRQPAQADHVAGLHGAAVPGQHAGQLGRKIIGHEDAPLVKVQAHLKYYELLIKKSNLYIVFIDFGIDIFNIALFNSHGGRPIPFLKNPCLSYNTT